MIDVAKYGNIIFDNRPVVIEFYFICIIYIAQLYYSDVMAQVQMDKICFTHFTQRLFGQKLIHIAYY